MFASQHKSEENIRLKKKKAKWENNVVFLLQRAEEAAPTWTARGPPGPFLKTLLSISALSRQGLEP